jgi:hypothetical protein
MTNLNIEPIERVAGKGLLTDDAGKTVATVTYALGVDRESISSTGAHGEQEGGAVPTVDRISGSLDLIDGEAEQLRGRNLTLVLADGRVVPVSIGPGFVLGTVLTWGARGPLSNP